MSYVRNMALRHAVLSRIRTAVSPIRVIKRLQELSTGHLSAQNVRRGAMPIIRHMEQNTRLLTKFHKVSQEKTYARRSYSIHYSSVEPDNASCFACGI